MRAPKEPPKPDDQDDELNSELAQSFPASDPPSLTDPAKPGGPARPEPGRADTKKPGAHKPAARK